MCGPPYMMSGDDILAQLEVIDSVKFGKISESRKQKRNESELNWTKQTYFLNYLIGNIFYIIITLILYTLRRIFVIMLLGYFLTSKKK